MISHNPIRSMLFVALLSILISGAGFANSTAKRTYDKPGYIPGEILINLKPGSTSADAAALAETINADVVRESSIPGLYLLRRRAAVAPVASPQELAGLRALSMQLSADSRVAHARPCFARYFHDSRPNDTLFNQQWALPMLGMPKVWDIQKGKTGIIVAVVDSGFDTSHPDLASRLLQGRDTADNDNDVNPPPAAALYGSHGTATASLVAAVTNNSVGIAGIIWENSKVLPVKVSPNAFPESIDTVGLLEAYRYLIGYSPAPNVLNLSLGGPFDDTVEHDLIRQLVTRGTIVVASAGNDDPFARTGYPASWTEVLSIAAVGPTKAKASYSSRGKIDFAAPGGEFGLEQDGIWHLEMNGEISNGVGTSFASPYAAGAIALLLGAGVQPNRIVDVLKLGAERLGGSIPNDAYGYGLINLAESFRKAGVLGIGININSPLDNSTSETRAVTLDVSFFKLDVSTLVIKLDGQVLPNMAEIRGMVTSHPTDPDQSSLVYNMLLSPNGADEPPHVIEVSGTSAQDPNVSDTKSVRISVTPRVLRTNGDGAPILLAIPYRVTGSPATVIGGDIYRMLRWVQPLGRYVDWFNDPDYRFSGFNPQNFTVTPEFSNTPINPLGTAWFVKIRRDTPIVVDVPAINQNVSIPLNTDWNLIGNPYPFAVDWATVEVISQSRRYTLNEAIQQNLMYPELWRYNGTGYEFDQAPSGSFREWEGVWIRAKQPVTLVLKPIASNVGRSASVRNGGIAQNADPNGWMMRLTAEVNMLRDTMNYIGVASNWSARSATIGAPPVVSPYVDVSFRPATGSDSLAKDIRRVATSGQTVWTVRVATDQRNANVVLRWQPVTRPRTNICLFLEDVATGQRINMNMATSYTFRSSGSGGTRTFRVILSN